MQEEIAVPLSVMEEKLYELRKRIMTLEWDKSHNQLNSSMEMKYAQAKTELEALQKQVDGIKAEIKGKEVAVAGAVVEAAPELI